MQKERVGGAVALEVDAVVAQAHGAGADDLEGHVHRAIEREQMLALRFEHLAIGAEGGEHGGGLRGGDAGEGGLDLLELPVGALL